MHCPWVISFSVIFSLPFLWKSTSPWPNPLSGPEPGLVVFFCLQLNSQWFSSWVGFGAQGYPPCSVYPHIPAPGQQAHPVEILSPCSANSSGTFIYLQSESATISKTGMYTTLRASRFEMSHMDLFCLWHIWLTLQPFVTFLWISFGDVHDLEMIGGASCAESQMFHQGTKGRGHPASNVRNLGLIELTGTWVWLTPVSSTVHPISPPTCILQMGSPSGEENS